MCIHNQSSYQSQAGDHLRAASGTPLAMAGEEKQKVELVKVDVIQAVPQVSIDHSI